MRHFASSTVDLTQMLQLSHKKKAYHVSVLKINENSPTDTLTHWIPQHNRKHATYTKTKKTKKTKQKTSTMRIIL